MRHGTRNVEINLCVIILNFLMSMANLNLGSQIFNLPQEQRKQVRDLEKASVKLTKAKCSKVFNKTCLIENILPNYSNIKLHDRAANNESFTIQFRRRLVQRELDNAISNISQLEEDVAEKTASLMESMDHELLNPILETISNNAEKEDVECSPDLQFATGATKTGSRFGKSFSKAYESKV